jgi:hypothetical protein
MESLDLCAASNCGAQIAARWSNFCATASLKSALSVHA